MKKQRPLDSSSLFVYIITHLKSDAENCESIAMQKLRDRLWAAKKQEDNDCDDCRRLLEINDYLKEHPELIDKEAALLTGTLDFKAFL